MWTLQQDYLTAMEGFQEALLPTSRLWNEIVEAIRADLIAIPEVIKLESGALSTRELKLSFQLAQRLLFCAYCEADSNQISSARQRLVQCLSILLQCLYHQGNEAIKGAPTSALQDAFMELMLSYEEVAEHRTLARHIAHLAIQCSGEGSCRWSNPLQRPGYMARIDSDPSKVLPCVPRDQHPDWCGVLEANWEGVADELVGLLNPINEGCWGMVGSGERGSGGDDHRVVREGGRWTEYILFGTGSLSSDRDAIVTKSLLRKHVATAVSLAESGGGEVVFSRLAPHTYIDAHCGPTNLRWTAHLGLVVPAKGVCRIRVANEWHGWHAGKILLFDDSFEHEVINDTDEERIVLLIRLWHPGLSARKREEALHDARVQKERAIENRYHPPS
jgi:Aspartyl/Asparaginyl beta-hydroxylase